LVGTAIKKIKIAQVTPVIGAFSAVFWIATTTIPIPIKNGKNGMQATSLHPRRLVRHASVGAASMAIVPYPMLSAFASKRKRARVQGGAPIPALYPLHARGWPLPGAPEGFPGLAPIPPSATWREPDARLMPRYVASWGSPRSSRLSNTAL
jgi:hypothetical protein